LQTTIYTNKLNRGVFACGKFVARVFSCYLGQRDYSFAKKKKGKKEKKLPSSSN
jgi:hypothetical protein